LRTTTQVTKKGDMSGLYRNLLKTNTKYGGAATTGAASERAATMGAASERAATMGAASERAATTEAASEAAPAPVRSPVAAAAAATDVERPLRPNPQVRAPTLSWEVVSHCRRSGRGGVRLS
jgi:hypothetical protein